MIGTYLNAEWIGGFLFSVIRISTPLILRHWVHVLRKKQGFSTWHWNP